MRLLLKVTDLDTRATRSITVTGEREVPELVAGYALRYARLLGGLDTAAPHENTPQTLALFPGEEDDSTDDAA